MKKYFLLISASLFISSAHAQNDKAIQQLPEQSQEHHVFQSAAQAAASTPAPNDANKQQHLQVNEKNGFQSAAEAGNALTSGPKPKKQKANAAPPATSNERNGFQSDAEQGQSVQQKQMQPKN